jgi:hypothetical protein
MGISHLASLNTHPDVQLVAICDTTPYVLESLQKYMPFTAYTDYRKMLSTEKLDAVFVALNPRRNGARCIGSERSYFARSLFVSIHQIVGTSRTC